VDSGQVSAAVTEVRRGKAASLIAEKVKVTDEAGNPIDVKAQVESLIAAQQADLESAADEGDTVEADADEIEEAE
jgi:hypothetical protein